MTVVGRGVIPVTLDKTGLAGDLRRTNAQTTRGFKSMGIGAGTALKAGIIGGTALAGAAIVRFVGDSIRAASDLSETWSKSRQIFGSGALADLRKFAGGAAKELGQSRLEALNAAATFGVFGKSAGLTGKKLVTFSTGFTRLASDMASFNNTSPQEAIDAIGAALRGEAEPIRRFSVLLDDATLRNRALKLGLIETTKQALTPQQKVLAAQAEIYAQTKDQQGDFARTSGGLANQQRILRAQFDNVKTSLGRGLLPIATSFVTFLNAMMIPAAAKVGDGFNRLRDLFAGGRGGGLSGAFSGVSAAGAGVVDALQNMVTRLRPIVLDVAMVIRRNWGPIKAWAMATFKQIVGVVVDALNLLAAYIRAVTAIYLYIWRRWGNEIIAIATVVFRLIAGVIRGALNIIQGIIRLATALIKGDWRGAWDAVKQILRGAWQVIVAVLRAAWSTVKGIITTGAKTVLGLIRGIPGQIKALVGPFTSAGTALMRGLIHGLKSGAGFAGDFAGAIWLAVKSTINSGIDRLNSLLEFTIPVPGMKDIKINPRDIGHLAKGTDYWRGGWTIVGEEGPELVNLRRGAQVIPTPRLQPDRKQIDSDWMEGMGGPSVTVNAPQNTDPYQVADIAAGNLAAALKGY